MPAPARPRRPRPGAGGPGRGFSGSGELQGTLDIMTLRRLALLTLAAGLGAVVWMAVTPPPALREGPLTVFIPPHESILGIASRVKEADVVRSRVAFVATAVARGVPRSLKAGEYEVPRDATTWDVVTLLESGQVRRRAVLHPEGASIAELGRAFEAEQLTTAEEVARVAADMTFLAAHGIEAASVEGYVFPDTYYFVRGMTAEEMLGRMVQRMRSKLSPALVDRARARGLSKASPSASTHPPVNAVATRAAGSIPAARHAACMSVTAAFAAPRWPAAWIQLAPSSAVSLRPRGPSAETWSGIGSRTLMAPISGLRNRIFRRRPSNVHSSVSPASRPCTTRTYSRMSSSFTGPRPMVRRAVKPVEMPKSTRPGASALRAASALAATGAMRFEGMSTPVASRIRDVCTAAAPMATNMSALSSCVS